MLFLIGCGVNDLLLFFFFKQKTAYELRLSLVGSEMCIRDSQFAETGLFGVYAGCQPGRVDEVLAICREQLDAVGTDGVTDEEIARGKGQLKGSLVLGLEDTGSRMSRIGKSELVDGELLGVDEVIARIDAVTPEDVRAVAA